MIIDINENSGFAKRILTNDHVIHSASTRTMVYIKILEIRFLRLDAGSKKVRWSAYL
jgi:hypothetical protein